MLQRCISEIRDLRGYIARLEPKAKAYDDISLMLNAIARQPGQGLAEDVVWRLEKRKGEIEKVLAAEVDHTEGETT